MIAPQETFAYLFERFPAFSQTFVYREVLAMRGIGVKAKVFSIREPSGEPSQDFPPELNGITEYLPPGFQDRIEVDAGFRRAARRGIKQLSELWGDESEKRRIYEALWLAPELRRARISHVHAHFAGMAARTAFWLHRLEGIRFSFTAHANDIFCDEPIERLDQMISAAEFVATETEFSAKFLRERHPAYAGKIFRIFNGIPLPPLTRAVATHPPLVIGVGRYIEKKGFEDLIAACRQLQDIEFECQIVGQGPLENALRQQAGSGAGNVVITGARTQNQITAAFAQASIFVLPCVYAADGGSDNLPTVIMEAMAAGLPVISTPVAGVPEMVVDGETGYLVPEHDPGALAARIRTLLGDPGQAQAMGLAGRRRCEQLFDAERVAGHLRDILQKHGALESPTVLPWWNRWFKSPAQ
jgi:glycosyltransferase involved in cell wall biosynthesis